MPTPRPGLTLAAARRHVAARAFAPSDGVGERGHPRMGIEVEWLPARLDDPTVPAAAAVVRAAARTVRLAEGSGITFEPGGQVELSTPPRPGLGACRVLGDDAAALGRSLAASGVGLVGIGLEPVACRRRVERAPRYEAMEAYFDSLGPAGATMMRDTAAIQVNIDLGADPDEAQRRWRAAHDVGPVLAAAFANSPLRSGRPTGLRSTRLAVWQAVDHGRSAPARNGARGDEAWADYALRARVMLVRCSPTAYEPVREPMTFAEWVTRGHPTGWPTLDDLDYHLTTLFPPVRPRGWLELRAIDALPDPWWRVAAAVSTVLVADARLDRCVVDATRALHDGWHAAARHGLGDPAIAVAARRCFAAARAVLDDHDPDAATVAATREFVERYVTRGRCPADDVLDAYANGTALVHPDFVPAP